MINRMAFAALFALCPLPTLAMDLGDYQLVDLSHSYGPETVYWPTSPTAFIKEELDYGISEGGWFYSSYSVCTPEHGGTHIDAPLHFAEGGISTEKIPLENLLAPAIVIDVSGKAAADRDYRLTVEDVSEFEAAHGKIAPGTIVLLRTDWSRHWPDTLAYLGDDTPGDATKLRFPGYGEAATRILVEQRGVAMLGIDSASIDYGKSQDYIAHRVGASRGVSNLENLAHLDRLPPTGSIILALPMKIAGGSGGPVRVVALVPR